MFADRSLTSASERAVSLGVTLAITSGTVIAMIVALAPPEWVKPIVQPFTIYTVPETPPPPPEPVVRPRLEPRPAEPVRQPIVVPKPVVPVTARSDFDTTDVIPPMPEPPVRPGTGSDPVAIEPARPAPLPLVGASLDMRYAGDLQPLYPAGEMRAGREGSVTVRVLIGTDGRVKQVEQVSATSPAFFDATRRQALAKWRFRPATRGDVPEQSWKVMTVRFRMDD